MEQFLPCLRMQLASGLMLVLRSRRHTWRSMQGYCWVCLGECQGKAKARLGACCLSAKAPTATHPCSQLLPDLLLLALWCSSTCLLCHSSTRSDHGSSCQATADKIVKLCQTSILCRDVRCFTCWAVLSHTPPHHARLCCPAGCASPAPLTCCITALLPTTYRRASCRCAHTTQLHMPPCILVLFWSAAANPLQQACLHTHCF